MAVDTEELQAIEELKAMSLEELNKVPHETVRWQCKVKLCKCFTRMRYYGITDVYYHKGGVTNQYGRLDHWINVRDTFFICHKHWKVFKNRTTEDIPLKRSKNGGLIFGCNDTGKEKIIY